MYLNDRKYRVCDIGEGNCTLLLSYAQEIESLHEHFSHQFLEIDRMIVIDISTCWSVDIDLLGESERCELMKDIRLLADIYWLEDYEIKTDKGLEIYQVIPL
ncbi:hypothetical protein [Vibrio jasicida]|uniref:hypothetical protein n=1 Tax=Vibrio jasicida TaxID=766224 RepID=UPI0021584EE0|nr:hypothetical protein [Vibrio jasicida]